MGKCKNCEDNIKLTDVSGHYSGVCKDCRKKGKKGGDMPDSMYESLENQWQDQADWGEER